MKSRNSVPEKRLKSTHEEIERLIKEKKLDENLINELFREIFRERETNSIQRLKVFCKNPYNVRCLISLFAEILFSLEDGKIESGHLDTPLIVVDKLMEEFLEAVKENPENGNILIALAAGVYKRIQSLFNKIRENPENRKYIVPSSYSGISYTEIIGMAYPRELNKALQILNAQDIKTKAKAIYLLAKHAGWNSLALHYIDEISKIEESKREPIIEVLSNIFLDVDSNLLKDRKDLYETIKNLLLRRLENLPEEYLQEIARYYRETYGWRIKSPYRNHKILIPLLYVLETPLLEGNLRNELENYSKLVEDFYEFIHNLMGRDRASYAYSIGFIIDNYDLIKKLISSPLIKQHRNSPFVREILFRVFEKILPYRNPLTEKEKKKLFSLVEKTEKIIHYIPKIDKIIEIARNKGFISIFLYLTDVVKYYKDVEKFEKYLKRAEGILNLAIKIAKKYGLEKWDWGIRMIYDDIIEEILKDKNLRKAKNYISTILEEVGSRLQEVYNIQKELKIKDEIEDELGPLYLLPSEEMRRILEKILKDKETQNIKKYLSSFKEKLRKRIEDDYKHGKLEKDIYELLYISTYSYAPAVATTQMRYYKLIYKHPEKKEAIINYIREIVRESIGE